MYFRNLVQLIGMKFARIFSTYLGVNFNSFTDLKKESNKISNMPVRTFWISELVLVCFFDQSNQKPF